MKGASVKLFMVLAILAAFACVAHGLPFEWHQGLGNDIWAQGCDFLGNDIRTVPMTHALSCGDTCRGYTGCNHWAWNRDQCFLKSADSVWITDAVQYRGSTYATCGLMNSL
ncbi:hypothetical protein I4F81_003520 [Pyropia yezoensis]|uniref:Uncharacterized protein n=1 Tax=Pyropia yezoensis TaxID=2788 RepID=A0ACC3BT99_PYRYE|nr:hypothetical protein I4F81_003520 [Neopyropia yezoensis]|eukprot:contig_33842_g8165